MGSILYSIGIRCIPSRENLDEIKIISHTCTPFVHLNAPVEFKFVGLKVARLIPEMAPLLGGGDGNAASDNQLSTPRLTKKVGRNDPCICGSKKKYKVCCGKA